MRILHVIPSLSSVHGGPSAAMVSIEMALRCRGLVVETATTDDDIVGRIAPSLYKQRIVEGDAVRVYFHRSLNFYKVAWSFVPWIVREVRRYDAVHIHALFSFTSVVAAWAARRAGVPYVIRPLGVLGHYGLARRRKGLKTLSLRFIEGPLVRDAAAVHFTSTAERDEALSLGLSMRPVVVPLGVPIGGEFDGRRLFGDLMEGRAPAQLLFLSRIDRKKNLEGVIGALALLRRAGKFALLRVGGTGDGAYIRHLKRLARTEGVSDQIRWLGHMTGSAKADLLAESDIFVLASFSENFGISVVEALAAGLPCVVGRGVAVSGQISNAGAGIVVDTDATSIAGGIAHYLASAERRAKAAEAGRALAQQEFSVGIMGERLAALYQSIRR